MGDLDVRLVVGVGLKLRDGGCISLVAGVEKVEAIGGN